MQSLTVAASSLEVAQGLSDALSGFHPEIVGSEDEGYQVRVSLAGGDGQIIAILDALERHVTERHAPARVQFDGRSYVLHPE